jgi:LysR family transcriptional regulator, hydrogen peroxide-inducible genes activator
MNLRDLQYVCAVADAAHFGKAAESCHVSQPTLSGQIKKLEESLGVVLFERTNRSVRLTEAGGRIVEIARTVLRAAEEIERTARACQDPTSGTLRIGMIPTIAPSLIPLVVLPLRERFPALTLALVEDTTDRLLAQLERGDIDAAVIATAPEDPRLPTIPLYREPFWFALPERHPLLRRSRIDPKEVEPHELLLLTDGHCLREQALSLCGRKAAGRRADTSATSLETIINLVAAGQGVTLVPALSIGIASRAKGVALRRPKAASAERLVRLVYRPGFYPRPLLEPIAAVIRAVVPESVTPVD